MRVPTADVQRRPLGLRGWLIGAAIVLVLLLFSLRGLARFYTDYLWFKEIDQGRTWRSLLTAKAVPALIFSAAFFVLMVVNLIVADRIAPRHRATGPEDEIIERYRQYVTPYAGRLRVGVALFFAIVMGGGVSAEWRNWILFSNSVKVGIEDPQFHKDIGFYLFRLPFMEFAAGWTFAALLVVLIVTSVFHYLNGGIRLQSPIQRVTPQVKVHLSVILALMALTKTVQYYLARYELTLSHRGFVHGATYTDVKAQLPALNLLMLISVAAAILFIANIFRRGWVFPVIAVGLWGFISIVVGTIYPAVIQRFVVQPNELSREEPYIKRNIEATQAAFALDSKNVTTEEFQYETTLSEKDVEDNQETLANIRLWDPVPIGKAFQITQALETFYEFSDVDVDRYGVRDESRKPSLAAVRELDLSNLPDKSWTNQHLVYTHGSGVVAAAADEVAGDAPSYLLKDIPPKGVPPLELEQTGVYFGENFGGYAVVGTKVAEQQVSTRGSTESVKYTGRAGVPVSSFLRKAALALRFGDWNLFVSGQVTSDSRVIYMRDIQQRASTAAPFLRFDADPYPVVLDGRIVWVLDAYTTSNRYPYSQSLHPRDLPAGSGLDTELNYVRNSVKATVDAYDGTVHFYVVDPKDPIIRVYRKAFPQLFEDVKAMPLKLRDHWRYPEDVFKVQTEQFALYHMTDPAEFFRKQDLWDIAPAPEFAEAPATPSATASGAARNTTLPGSNNPVTPLYLTMEIPGGEGQEFVLQRSYVPRRKANLSSFIMARNDGENYGKLVVYETQSNSAAPSPAQAASSMESDQVISSQFTLLDQKGSEVVRGDVQLIPIGNTIVFVRPIWVEGVGSQTFPRFRFVAAALGERSVLACNVPDAIDALVNNTTPSLAGACGSPEATTPGSTPPDGATTTTTTPGSTTPTTAPTTTPPTGDETAAELVARAREELAAAEEARQAGDLGSYQAHVTEAGRLLDQANAQDAAGSTTTTAPATTSTTGPVNT